MSEIICQELKILVERVVRPLSLTLVRQQRLRNELSQHLQAIYQEELARDGDPAKALSRTSQRFGDPTELTEDIRKAVGRWELCEARLERTFARRRNETVTSFALRMIGRFALLELFAFCFGLLMMLDHHLFGTEPLTIARVQVAFAAVAFLFVWFSGFLICSLHCGAEWDHHPRRWSRIVGYSVASFAAWPVSMIMMMALAEGTWSAYSIPITVSILGGCHAFIIDRLY